MAATKRSLRTVLDELNQKRATSKRDLHLKYLKAFSDHGKKASVQESLDLLGRLVQSRNDQQRADLRTWRQDCAQHQGFTLLRERLLQTEPLKDLPSSVLSNMYNKLQRLNFEEEAQQVWPVVSEKVSAGQMKNARELLGIWSVAPKENLSLVDGKLAQAVRDSNTNSWQLVSTIARGLADMPNSKAAQASAKALEKHLADLSSNDLADIVGRLGQRSEMTAHDSPPVALESLLRRAKAELVMRDGEIEIQHLCGMLGAIESCNEALWPVVRRQLLVKKDLKVKYILETLRFLQRASKKEEEQPLRGKLVKQLQSLLQKGVMDANLVAEVSRHLDVIVGSSAACQALLNSAVKLREDLHPAVNWRLFVRAGEANLLAHHPMLQARLDRIGKILEQHGIGRKGMSLNEMVSVARAMRANNVKLESCAEQMAKHFVEVLNHGEEGARRRAEAAAAKADAEAAEAAKASEEAEAKTEEKNNGDKVGAVETKAEGVQETGEPTAEKNSLLGEVQRQLLIFWTQLNSLDLEEPSLTEAALATCAKGADLRLEAKELAQCAAELTSLGRGSEAKEMSEALLGHLRGMLRSLELEQLLEVAELAPSDMSDAIVAEVKQRLQSSDGTSGLQAAQNGKELDSLVSLLLRFSTWQASTDIGDASLRVAGLVSETFEEISKREPKAARRRLLATTKAFAAVGVGEAEPSLAEPLRITLHQLAAGAVRKPWPLTEASEFAFSFTLLHGGDLPFDVASRLWRLAGSSIAGDSDSSAIAGEKVAKLWAFGLAIQNLSSKTVLASLRLAEDAPALEAFLASKEKLRNARFELNLEEDSSHSSLIAQLRSALPATLPGELSEQQFRVPETPYVVDIGLEGMKAALVVPRPEHRLVGVQKLSGRGRLMENTLQEMGWRTCWVWPEEWSAKLSSSSSVEGPEGAAAREALRIMLFPEEAAKAAAADAERRQAEEAARAAAAEAEKRVAEEGAKAAEEAEAARPAEEAAKAAEADEERRITEEADKAAAAKASAASTTSE
eukprot:TRINITY_DN24219_c0_g1_i1.p1 TRINITY_DN24219_c0_g1~~TRINITY_DN24219_c0_g1_i1.p1  ORF type:complete len:1021 (+),score=296.66 TRINITY_DN24219_c0_g1_i1:130-3192(+)